MAAKKKSTKPKKPIKPAKPAADRPMPPMRKRFAEEFVIDLNETKAAERAGYSVRSAHSTGCNLLKDPKVKALVAILKTSREERTQVTADRTLLELARVGLSDIRNVCSWSEKGVVFIPSDQLNADHAATIASVKSRTTTKIHPDMSREVRHDIEVKMWDKLKALTEIGKHLGIADKMDLTVKRAEFVDMTDAEVALQVMRDAKTVLESEG